MQPKAKLIAGFIANDEDALKIAQESLVGRFGAADFISARMPFDATRYYCEEMGEGLQRLFVSFENLIDLEGIERIKIETIDIERRLSKNKKRTVNIDPGCLELSKLVLLTTKNYAHRIYLGKGIFAEVTLIYLNGTYIPMEWTYPDYRSPGYVAVFNRVRAILKSQLTLEE